MHVQAYFEAVHNWRTSKTETERAYWLRVCEERYNAMMGWYQE